MVRRIYFGLAAFMAVLALAVPAAAQIATYDFTGSPGNQANNPASGVDPNLTASVLDRGPGVTAGNAVNSISSSGWSTAALDVDDYYQFTLSANAGFTLDLDSIVFSERRSGTGIRDIAIRTSLDSFTANVFTANVPDDTLTRRQNAVFGPTFDSVIGPLTIRIYGFNAEAAGGTWRLGISGGADNPDGFPANLLVNGRVNAIPEPTTLLLGGIGMAGVVYARRRKIAKKKSA